MTNEELKKLSDDTFFDNDTGEIQPESHRNFNNHLIDHTDTVSEAALRNAKEYTDAREATILAAADTKDETTLRTAKEYADRIVAALAGSAPDLLNTLEELATALNNDPNFSATVMELIGKRVTAEAMAEALAGKANKNGDASEIFNASVVKSDYLNLTKDGTSNYMYVGRGDAVSSSYKSTDELIYNAVGRVVLAGVGDPVSVDSNNMSVRIIWHSGNLKPTYYAQIDPRGGIISKSADWIQSVTWKSDGNGMQCYILPKVTVNLATAHVTKVRTGGNVFKGRAPVVCDELLGGCIVVATPGDNGASEEDYFNISIQGA